MEQLNNIAISRHLRGAAWELMSSVTASEPASGDTATTDAFIVPIKKMVQLTQWLWSNRIRETHPLPSWMPPINDYHVRPANLAAECELTPYHIEGMQWLNRHYEVRNRSFLALLKVPSNTQLFFLPTACLLTPPRRRTACRASSQSRRAPPVMPPMLDRRFRLARARRAAHALASLSLARARATTHSPLRSAPLRASRPVPARATAGAG